MCTYNGASFLADQLASFERQTLHPHELIAWDDASTDGTWALLERFSYTAPFPVRLHRAAENAGIAKSFDRALRLATGDIIFLSDQDDVWHPNKLSSMVAHLERHPDLLVLTCDQEIVPEDLASTGQTSFTLFARQSRRGTPFAVGCCTAIRKPFCEALLPVPDGFLAHDVWLNSLSDALGVRQCLPDVLQLHRRHATNASPDRLNPTRRVGLRGRFDLTLADAPQAACELRLWTLEPTSERLQAIERSAPSCLAGIDATEATRRLDEERSALQHRRALLSKPRSRRVPSVLKMAVRGDYRHFSGWRSLLKDMISRTAPAGSSPPGHLRRATRMLRRSAP